MRGLALYGLTANLGLLGGGQWRKMANNGEKWRIMAMANSAFSFVKFAIFRQFLILEFHI